MKLKATMLFLGLCLALSVVAASPAYARSIPAFSSFHVQSATVLTDDAYLCLTEDNGAVVNNCAYDVNLEFDLPIDAVGNKTISVQDYWNGPSQFTSFECVSYAYTGKSSSSTSGTIITFTAPLMELKTKDSVPSGNSMTVICWQVPPGEGVAGLHWNP